MSAAQFFPGQDADPPSKAAPVPGTALGQAAPTLPASQAAAPTGSAQIQPQTGWQSSARSTPHLSKKARKSPELPHDSHAQKVYLLVRGL